MWKVPEKYKTKSRQKVLLVVNRYYPIKHRVKYTEKLITAFLPEKKCLICSSYKVINFFLKSMHLKYYLQNQNLV